MKKRHMPWRRGAGMLCVLLLLAMAAGASFRDGHECDMFCGGDVATGHMRVIQLTPGNENRDVSFGRIRQERVGWHPSIPRSWKQTLDIESIYYNGQPGVRRDSGPHS